MTQRCPPGPVAEWATQLRANSLRQGHPCRLDLCRPLRRGRVDFNKVLPAVPLLSLGGQWIQHWHWRGRARGAEWPCAPVTLSQMIHYSWGGASSRTCDTHRWVDSSFVLLSAGHGIQGPGGWGAGKGSKSGNHKYDPNHHFHLSLALEPDRERTAVGLVIRADGGHKVKGGHRRSH